MEEKQSLFVAQFGPEKTPKYLSIYKNIGHA
jgi:hypothetical protein